MAIKRKAIWVSYDFGLKGDYTGLFTWLDNHKAVECGSGLAFLFYDLSNMDPLNVRKDFIDYVIADFKEFVKLSKSDRLYMIWKDNDSGKVRGEFISGNRKQSPWEGYGKLGDNIADIQE